MTVIHETKRLERTISGGALALLVIGCLVVLWPFISALLWAVILAFASWPIYRRMVALTGGRRTLGAVLMTLLTTLVLLVPFLIVGFTLADNLQVMSDAWRHATESGPPSAPAWIAKIPMIGPGIASYWHTVIGDSQSLLRALGKLVEPLSGILLAGGLTLGHGIIDLAISIFVAFFLYRDGIGMAHRAVRIARRIHAERGEQLLILAGATVRSVVHGILGTALAQALVAGLGYAIAGVPAAGLLTMITFFLAVTPIGPPLVWVPVTLWLLHKHSIGWATFMIVWGLMVTSIDNVLKPWLISHGSKMPFLLIFFGVIGGLLGFGFIGIFLGPTLLAVGYRLLKEWTAPIEARLTPAEPSGPITPGLD